MKAKEAELRTISGWYYLHQNKDLIYKAYPDAIADIRDSDLCIAAWAWDGQRPTAWSILVEALSMGANKERIKELAEKWNATDEDAVHYAEFIGVNLGVDGNQMTATRKDFINLHDSPCGFGENYLEALADLASQLGYKGSTLMWHATFKDLCNSAAMSEEAKNILIMIHAYMDANPSIRFGQALFNLGINEFADKKNPAEKNHLLRDIYNDTDEQIFKRITL